ncbi:hypothetical protein [Nocardia aurantia]|uniref:hypothetical protein n=1 Tax=Nocardia aurantia TaxID=2585199 RepID=UPI0012949C95|nr:hypothetical protein [Nocardia aurantia]
MFDYFTKRALVLLSVLATPVAVAGPAEAVPINTVHCGRHYDNMDWQGPIDADNTFLDAIFITINVGGDDIRSDTGVSAEITFRKVFNQTPITTTAVVTSGPHPNDSNFFGKIPMGSRADDLNSLISPSGIDKIEIFSTSSGSTDPFSTSDNWNMDSISVQYAQINDPSALKPLFWGSGQPWLHRFKKYCDNESGEGGPRWAAISPRVGQR